MKRYEIFEYEENVDFAIVEQFYKIFDLFPKKLKTAIRNLDLNIVIKNQFESGLLGINENAELICIQAVEETRKQEIIICCMLQIVIDIKIETYGLNTRYLNLEEKYKDVLETLRKPLVSSMNMLGVLMYYYIDENYGILFFAENNLWELFDYIDEWMTDKVFNISKTLKNITGIEANNGPTIGALESLDMALKIIPENIKKVDKQKVTFVVDGKSTKSYAKSVCAPRPGAIYIPSEDMMVDIVFTYYGYKIFQVNIAGRTEADKCFKLESENFRMVQKDTRLEEDTKVEKKEDQAYARLFFNYFFTKEAFKEHMPETYAFYQKIMNSYGIF